MTFAAPGVSRPAGEFGVTQGAAPGRLQAVLDTLRPVLASIAEDAARRDRERALPIAEIRWLREARVPIARLPVDSGGLGLTLPEFVALLVEVAEADSNLPQILRAHLFFVEDIVGRPNHPRRARWLPRLAAGDLVGGAWTEGADSKLGTFTTRVVPDGDGWRLTGRKFYSTGAIFADWIDVGAVDPDGTSISATVATRGPGVTLIDDWDGFGQLLTGSGTSVFEDAVVEPGEVIRADQRISYAPAFLQTIHLATLAGIAKAAARDAARLVFERTRNYSHASGTYSREDPQVLQVVGQVHSQAYAARAIVLQAAEALERAHQASVAGDPVALEEAAVAAEIEIAQAQVVVARLVLDATTTLFDALGASATRTELRLDRHWRNARTLSSHNPLIYKERIVGSYAVNRTPPPFQWTIGKVSPA